MWKKMMEFLGLGDEESSQERKQEEARPDNPSDAISLQRKAAVVNLHTQKQVKLILCEPESFETAQEIADHLRSHRPVVLNLHKTQFDNAMRIVDFVSGTIYALGGRMEKIGHQIFLCTPENIDIQGKISDLFKENAEIGANFQKVK